jgi:hypothetical protein
MNYSLMLLVTSTGDLVFSHYTGNFYIGNDNVEVTGHKSVYNYAGKSDFVLTSS